MDMDELQSLVQVASPSLLMTLQWCLISSIDESAHRRDVEQRTCRCRDSNPSLCVAQTKKIIVDFGRTCSTPSALHVIVTGTVERDKSFKFLVQEDNGVS
ncbi:hypothetical protein P4O66_017752 [Electrophorus voltai]|uniref:Uncharacterized protein n=1 Tax=Electrophorus voltai TaxID=2609070 RepID=A0AAD9DNC5_9TELE|nr:hypothetical protein P4O66_017752 [Electrophorus voltai]